MRSLFLPISLVMLRKYIISRNKLKKGRHGRKRGIRYEVRLAGEPGFNSDSCISVERHGAHLAPAVNCLTNVPTSCWSFLGVHSFLMWVASGSFHLLPTYECVCIKNNNLIDI